MKKLIVILTVLLTLSANAGLKSPFKSSVEGINIPNTHDVEGDGSILRGMAPFGHINELAKADVTDILIFKNQTRDEVDKEIALLKEAGYSSKNIHHIAFKWKGFESYKVACEQTIEALQIMKRVWENGGKTFFHCTVGEDRTGYLAGLWRMMSAGWTMTEAFQGEMCENGYGHGNPQKPWKVYGAIRKDLTPLYIAMASMVESGKLSYDNLDVSLCNDLKVNLDQKVPTCNVSSKIQK